MSASTALGAVSVAMRRMLSHNLTNHDRVGVTLLRPDEAADPPRVNLFLHRIDEQASLRNAEPRLAPGSATALTGPPLSLSLTYLVTAYGVPDSERGDADAHAILGDAMRVFHQFPVIPADYLDDDLAASREHLRVRLRPYDLEVLSQLWAAFDDSFRLSVQYDVSLVQLDPPEPAVRPLAPRVRTVDVAEVAAPYVPPRVTGLDPVAGPAGTQVTVRGAGLDGWRATVDVSGRRVVDDEPVAGDAVPVPLPADLGPGFHEVRVDVSALARATFFFEVS